MASGKDRSGASTASPFAVRHRHAIAGGVAGFVSRVVASPFDVVKIRMQLQVEDHTTGRPKYGGIGDCFRTILREEGAAAFWKGHVSAQLLTISYGVVQFACHDKILRACQQAAGPEHAASSQFVSGGAAGVIATAVTYPFDLMRTRFSSQGDGPNRVYSGLVHGFRTVLQTEGPAAFFKGASVTIANMFPYAGLQFMLYDRFKKGLGDESGHLTEPRRVLAGYRQRIQPVLSAVLGSGMLSKAAVFPMDTVKKRLQVQGFEEARQSFGRVGRYHGALHCLRTILAEEGARGLYKGLPAAVLKGAPTTAVTFCVYEWACRHLSSLDPTNDPG